MPQMAPISWLILFILFSFSFLLFNVINYFSFFVNKNISINTDNSKTMTKNNFLTWKW